MSTMNARIVKELFNTSHGYDLIVLIVNKVSTWTAHFFTRAAHFLTS